MAKSTVQVSGCYNHLLSDSVKWKMLPLVWPTVTFRRSQNCLQCGQSQWSRHGMWVWHMHSCTFRQPWGYFQRGST